MCSDIGQIPVEQRLVRQEVRQVPLPLSVPHCAPPPCRRCHQAGRPGRQHLQAGPDGICHCLGSLLRHAGLPQAAALRRLQGGQAPQQHAQAEHVRRRAGRLPQQHLGRCDTEAWAGVRRLEPSAVRHQGAGEGTALQVLSANTSCSRPPSLTCPHQLTRRRAALLLLFHHQRQQQGIRQLGLAIAAQQHILQ